jgi:dolichol-phosphate mannosyltransferase
MTKVTLICPVHQDEATLPARHEALFKALRPLEGLWQFEIIYVDDGSTDGTLGLLNTIAEIDRRVRVLSLTRRFGLEAAVLAGLEHAGGELVMTLDPRGDLPDDAIARLLEHADGGQDVVVGMADSGQPGWRERVRQRLLHLLCEAAPAPQATCNLLLTHRAVATLLSVPEQQRSLLGQVYWLGLPRREVPLPGLRMRPQATAADIDTLLAFSRKPLHWAGWLGAVVFGVGVLLALCFPIQALLRPGSVWFSWGYLIVLLHLLGGSILAAIGVAGAYLGRVLEQVKQRPLYVLKFDSQAQPAAPRQAA